jgi:hypothetical protein
VSMNSRLILIWMAWLIGIIEKVGRSGTQFFYE